MGLQTSYTDFPPIGYAGQLTGGGHQVVSMKNVEASASMPFGAPVVYKLSSPATPQDVLLPFSSADLVAGLIVKSHAYERAWTDADGVIHGELDSVGVITGYGINVLKKGRMIALCTSGCAVGDRLFVSFAAGSVYTAKGQLGNVTDTNALDCTKQASWQSVAAAGGLAMIDVDFVNKP